MGGPPPRRESNAGGRSPKPFKARIGPVTPGVPKEQDRPIHLAQRIRTATLPDDHRHKQLTTEPRGTQASDHAPGVQSWEGHGQMLTLCMIGIIALVWWNNTQAMNEARAFQHRHLTRNRIGRSGADRTPHHN